MDGEEKGGELPKLGGRSGGKAENKVLSLRLSFRASNLWQF